LTSTTWQTYAAWIGTKEGKVEHTVVGDVHVLPDFASPELQNKRNILVYLPPSYRLSSRRYPVIYMHDGQNLFDAATSYAGEWQVDETLETTSRIGLEAIVVGIPNQGVRRVDEYSPFVDPGRGGGKGRNYTAFIVETLKPRIDHDFRTQPDREHTGIVGSSMGGLISLYAFFQQPHVFGFAGVMSPAFWFGRKAIFSYVQALPYVPGRIYMDIGTREGPRMLADSRRMELLLRRKGYTVGQELLYVEESGAFHQEAAWARRLPAALHFLLNHPPYHAGNHAGAMGPALAQKS
jgi:predicted alpha/beta superfamily hydrolase